MIADRVKETTTTTGTGSLTLAGAAAQFQSFNTAFGTSTPFFYAITDANGTDWEIGTGELSDATTLVRTTVHQSSNADAKINLSAGTHTVFNTAPETFLTGLATKAGKLSQFGATTSAELAGVISDETGSGGLVFATSPSLTTPNIGAATASSVNGTTIPNSKTLVVTTDKLSALAATTSSELAGVISDETGSGSLVFATSPTLTTPDIGVATATSVNGTTIPSSKTLVVTTDKLSALAATTSAELAGVISDETGSGALVFASSPSLTTPNIGAATATSVNGTTIPSSKTLVVTTDKLSALAATTSAELAGVISDETGSGLLVFATSPSLTTPNLGTPSAGTLSNCTGLPVGGVSGLGTGVATALAVNTGTSGAVVVNGGALGTPSSGTLTNATGLPVSSGISGLGTNVATALGTNVGSAGAFVVNGGALGTPSGGTLTNATGLPLSTGVTGTLPIGNGGTGQTTYTDGQLLIGNSTGNTLTKATLTAGSGVTITNGSGSITIASSGSMVYPGAGIAVSTGSAWGTSLTAPSGTIVGTSDSQTLTNKTLTDPTIVGAIIEDVFTITDGASVDIDPANGTIQLWTLGASRTPTATNFAAGESVTLMIADGTAFTVTWTTIGVVWVGGSAPTLATSGYTVVELWKVSTTVYGALVGNVA